MSQQTTVRRPPPPAPDDDMPRAGDVLGRYRLTGLLGEGSSCQVFRGEHTRLPLAVAVKVFRPADRKDAASLGRLRSEAALLAGLNHPHVVRLWDFDDECRYPYLATELVDGRSLAKLIDDTGRQMPDWVAHLAAQVAAGLEAAHKLGVVHRDVKPGNILLAKDGTAKLADLGTAAVVRRRADGDTPAGPSSVVTGIAGTAAYVAPEQARDPAAADHRADIYSLGCTLYHALCGKLPFAGPSVMAVVFKHISEPPVPPADAAPGVPRELSDIVLRMMAKDPADRYPGYPQLRAALRGYLGDA